MEQPVKPVLLTMFSGPIVQQVSLIHVHLIHCEGLKYPEMVTSVFNSGFRFLVSRNIWICVVLRY